MANEQNFYTQHSYAHLVAILQGDFKNNYYSMFQYSQNIGCQHLEKFINNVKGFG
jgi:hypothetical protein